MRQDDRVKNIARYVESIRSTPFDPVTHNCALFAAGAVAAATGKDPVVELGIELHSEHDVAQVLERFGGVRGICEKYLGEMRAPLLAKRGDVVIKPGINGDTIGVCMGDHAMFLGPNGLQPRKLSECFGSWQV